jgi:hypothetical protein
MSTIPEPPGCGGVRLSHHPHPRCMLTYADVCWRMLSGAVTIGYEYQQLHIYVELLVLVPYGSPLRQILRAPITLTSWYMHCIWYSFHTGRQHTRVKSRPHIYDGHQENRNSQMSSLIRDRNFKCQRVGGDLDLLLGLCQDNRNLFDNRYIYY